MGLTGLSPQILSFFSFCIREQQFILYNYYHNNYIMQSETLLSLVGKIRVQRIRLAPHSSSMLNCAWSIQDSAKFYELIELYGADFGLIQAYFPDRSRKQIRRKYQEMEQRYGKRLNRIEMKRDQERRKNYFDQEILQTNMIKWPKKPNIAESSSSEDSL